MRLREYSLVPFPGEDTVRGLSIAGSIGRRAKRLSVRCTVLGNLSALAVPPPETIPERKALLWEKTCLELFLGVTHSPPYWEFNLSPAGHWNVYRFTSWREGMREEPAFAALPFAVRRERGALRVSLDLDIGEIVAPTEAIEVAVCAVIKAANGKTSHWALTHPGPRADFHRRDGFRLLLAGQ